MESCLENLSRRIKSKKSSIKNHISSVKHKTGKDQLQAKTKPEREI